jgi:hypothetical protein
MNLDTTRLKARIQQKIAQTMDRIHEIQEEMQRLEAEMPRLREALKTLDAAERIAAEHESASGAGMPESPRLRELSQSLVSPALEKLSAEMGVEMPFPGGAATESAGKHAPGNPDKDDSAEHAQFFAQWH